MQKIKKLKILKNLALIITFCVIMMATLSGCSSEKDGKTASKNTSASSASSNTKKYKIAFAQSQTDHPYRKAMVDRFQAYAKESLPDVDVFVSDAKGDGKQQAKDVEKFIADKMDVIIISPLTTEDITPVAKKATESGIKIVTIDRKVETPVSCHIGAENYPIGANIGKFISDKTKGKANVLEIQGLKGATPTTDRHSGFADTIAKSPGIKIIDSGYGDYALEPAKKVMEAMIKKHAPGSFDVVYCHNEDMALAAIDVLKKDGKYKNVLVTGIDGSNAGINSVKSGDMVVTAIYPTCMPEGLEYAYKVAKGIEVPPEVILESTTIDSSNIDKWIGKGF